MRKTVHIRVNTSVRKIGRNAYQVKTTANNGTSTRTVTKTIRAH